MPEMSRGSLNRKVVFLPDRRCISGVEPITSVSNTQRPGLHNRGQVLAGW